MRNRSHDDHDASIHASRLRPSSDRNSDLQSSNSSFDNIDSAELLLPLSLIVDRDWKYAYHYDGPAGRQEEIMFKNDGQRKKMNSVSGVWCLG